MDAAGSEPSVVLLCRVGARLCGVPLAHVSETLRPLPSDPFAGMPFFVRGLSMIRGAPVPVVDAAALLAGTPVQGVPGRFVTMNLGSRQAALAVDEVLGVRTVAAGTLADLPPLLAELGRDVVAAVGILDAELLLILRGARLLPESVWAGLAPGASAG